MERDFKSVAPSGSLEDVATLMHEHDVTHVPVVDGGKVVGIVARGDIVRFLAATT
jgi:CBS domain-containing protein